MADALLAIVIVNYETSAYVRRCVESLKVQMGVRREIVVVDNPSPLEDWKNLPTEGMRLVRNAENVGYGQACKAGVASASPEFTHVCILNPDVVVPEGQLQRWVERFGEMLPEGGLLAPKLLNENGSVQRSTYRFPGFWSYWVNHSILAGLLKRLRKSGRVGSAGIDGAAGMQEVDWAMGAAMLIDRKSWDTVGGFSADYFLYAEDMDLCYRLREAGKRVVLDPTVALIHSQGDPASESRHVAIVCLFTGLHIFLRKHYGARRRAVVSAAVIIDMAVRITALLPLRLLRPGDMLVRNRVTGYWQVLRLYCGIRQEI